MVIMLLVVKISYAAIQDTTVVKTRSAIDGITTGRVIDQNAHPLKGASVTVKGVGNPVTTGSEGEFEIKASPGNILILSAKGFYSQEVSIKQNQPLTIRMLDTYLQSPGKIDVLYGTTDASSVLGSISTIYTNQLTTTPASLYTYALPGQLAGLYTQQISGFTTNITGALSDAFGGVIASAHNLVITDNSEILLSLRGQTPVSVVNGIQRDISGLDPESIESVSVLKDGLSTILLGTNSSRGVIMVTTKKAEIGKPVISFTAQTGIQQTLGVAGDVLPSYQWAYLFNEALLSDGKASIYKKSDFDAYRDQTDPIGHPDVNWFKTILNDHSAMTNYKLNVSGGTQVTRYQISLSYLDQGGIFKTSNTTPYNTNNNLNRYILNTDMSVNVTKNLTVDLQMFARIQESTEPGAGTFNILRGLYTTPNNAYPIYNPNGSFGGSNAGGIGGPFSTNLLAQTQNSGYQKNNSQDILVNLDLNYNLNSVLKGLSAIARGNISIQSINLLDRSLVTSSYTFVKKDSTYSPVNSPEPQSNAFTNVYTSRYVFFQGALNYERQFGENHVSAMLMADMRNTVLNYDLSAQTLNRALKVSYNYKGKYFAEAAVNNSGYNRYPPGHQFDTYYAGGLGWQMAEEPFIKDNYKWIDTWKWRATYGRTGNNNIDKYQYYGFLQTFSQTIKGYGVGVNKTLVLSLNEDALANTNIHSEKGNKIDFGTDISLFKNHLQITADYYYDKYTNLLETRGNSILLIGANAPSETSSGLTITGNGSIYPVENIGTNLYKGFEFTLTYQNHINSFNYFIGGNVSIQSSKILFMDEQFRPYSYNKRTGQPVNAIFGYKAIGVFKDAADAASSPTLLGYTPQAGDIKYQDLNNDKVIDQFDQAPIANTRPLIFYGTTLGFNYKGFSFSVLLQGVTNRDLNLNNNTVVNGFTGVVNVTRAPYGQAYSNSIGRWTAETTGSAELPRLSLSNINNTQVSSFFIKSGNYFRIKNAEIGYTLPNNWNRRLGLSGIRVFANTENLLTIAGYKGFDPEVYPNNIQGVYPYPIQRVFNVGISIKL